MKKIGTYVPKRSDFILKRDQRLDDLAAPGESGKSCLLFELYQNITFQGAGTFGIVLLVTNKFRRGRSRALFALKFAEIMDEEDVDDGSYREVFIHYRLMQTLENDGFDLQPANIVKLYDWTKCILKLNELFLSPLYESFKLEPEDYDAAKKSRAGRSMLWDMVRPYQFLLLEFADSGTLWDLATNEPGHVFGNWNVFASFFIQIFATIHQLQILYGFTHYDLHAGNVLLDQLSDTFDNDEHLYYDLDEVVLAVPLFAGGVQQRAVCKINDMGLSRIYNKAMPDSEFPDTSPDLLDSPFEVADPDPDAFPPNPTNSKGYNPVVDLSKWTFFMINILVHVLIAEQIELKQVDPKVLELLWRALPKKWNSTALQQRSTALVKALGIMRSYRSIRPEAVALMLAEEIQQEISDPKPFWYEIPAENNWEKTESILNLLQSDLFSEFQYREGVTEPYIDMTLHMFEQKFGSRIGNRFTKRFGATVDERQETGIMKLASGKFAVGKLEDATPLCTHTFVDENEIIDYVQKEESELLCPKCHLLDKLKISMKQ